MAKTGGAIGTFFRGGRLIVGHDGRTSSPMFAQVLTGSLASTGCTVYNVGMAPTPAVQYAVKQYKMNGGVIITASHNPPKYNGIKVIADDGIELSRDQEIEVESIFFDDQVQWAKWDNAGRICLLSGILSVYKEAIKKHVDLAAFRKKRFHVVVDSGNGVGSLVTPSMLREMGCRVTTINGDIDGVFPNRPSEPRPENLEELAKTVRAVNADMGVAYDGDADRSIFVDGRGEIHWGDRTFALIVKHFLLRRPGEKIVTPVSSSSLIKEMADEFSGEIIWTRVGSVVVSHVMKKTKAKLGGEENGGVFYAPHQPVRDGAMATALVLNIMAKTEKSLSELLAELPIYHIEKDKLKCPNELKEQVFKDLIEQVEDMTIDITDGVKIWFTDKSSILMRPSGTEPICRFYAEGKTRSKVACLVREYKAKLSQIVDKYKSC
jgi:phosphomannomutase/phosphoglucomutase